ncbi:MAG TPA: glycogen debranching N-terminal domain-containing protein [Gaiellaceae bacterium]|nr:glycogen debranching N-terminal domain-containing protein [Gaiellaceae bacterium]
MNGARVPHPIEVLYGDGVAMACDLDGEVRADEPHGLFAADTRVLSTYRMTIGGQKWQLLGRYRLGQGTAHWRFQSPAIRDPSGPIPQGCLFLELNRRVSGALHDDLCIASYARERVRTTLVLQLDADFADVFEVKEQERVPPRLTVQRIPLREGIRLVYEHRDVRRGLRLTVTPTGGAVQFVGSLVLLDLVLERGAEWRLCLDAEPEVDGEVLRFAGDPHSPETNPLRERMTLTLSACPVLEAPFERGCTDLHALALPANGAPPYVAAGVPWFYTLFGRDTLVPALMAGLLGTWPAEGALAALGDLQASERDDWRDAEPGKLPHELRRGELARLGLRPHDPYYGAHDVPALYCLALWNAWRWTGDRALLDAHLDTASAALRWCEELGDRDGDGLQEYATRSERGYYNQSWKDAGDAIVHEDGTTAALPLATIELQGYLYGALLAMAELFDASGDGSEVERLRAAAGDVRLRVEERYWLPDRGFYAMALDGEKRVVASIGSNPGQLLWTGLPAPERARAVARRLVADDLFTGWGLRTLSAEHARYNPLSYQRGSVWPHDTALAAAGMWRYGLREEAATALRGVLEAACAFEGDRLPELFCGFDRSIGPPVPYREANVPQAWAAAVPVLAVQLFLGLVPDAPRGRCFVAPWLPDWMPSLEVRGIAVGEGTLDIVARRDEEETAVEITSSGVEVIEDGTAAPLWGDPARA